MQVSVITEKSQDKWIKAAIEMGLCMCVCLCVCVCVCVERGCLCLYSNLVDISIVKV